MERWGACLGAALGVELRQAEEDVLFDADR
jgi:hypothetical protein